MSQDVNCPELVCPDCDQEVWFIYSLNAYPVTTNEEMTIFVPCPEGFDCGGATVIVGGVPGINVTIPAGTITVRPTTPTQDPQTQIIGDANDQAPSQAVPVLNPKPKVYYNTPQSYTASCPAGKFGIPVTVSYPAGVFAAPTQALADLTALLAATQFAIQQLGNNCYNYTNTEQTATCPSGYTGDPVTIAAGTVFSNISQQDADDQAYQDAVDALSCTPTCAQSLFEALTWAHSGGGTGTGSGTNGTVGCNNGEAQSSMTTTLNNTCGAQISFQVSADCNLSTNNTGVVAKVQIYVGGVQMAISQQSLPGVGPTCYPKIETITTGVLTLNAGNSVQIVVAAYEQASSGCTGAQAAFTVSV